MTGSTGSSYFCFPSTSMFPLGPVIKSLLSLNHVYTFLRGSWKKTTRKFSNDCYLKGAVSFNYTFKEPNSTVINKYTPETYQDLLVVEKFVVTNWRKCSLVEMESGHGGCVC